MKVAKKTPVNRHKINTLINSNLAYGTKMARAGFGCPFTLEWCLCLLKIKRKHCS